MSDAWNKAWDSAWGVSWVSGGSLTLTPEGRRPKRRVNVEKEILSDDEEVMAFLHASLPDLIEKFWKH